MALVRRRWALVSCVVAAGIACPSALAVDPPPPPPTEPTPTVPEPPPATAPGPVATVPSPAPTPPPNVKPDLPPALPKKASAPKLTPAPKATPARKPAPAPKPKPAVRATARPSSPAPVRAVTPPSRPVRARTPVYPPRAAQPALPLKKQKKKKAKLKPAPVPFLGSKLPPIVQIPKAAVATPKVPAPAARANVLPLPSLSPGAAPSGLKQSLANLRWLFFAIMGTGVVFLTAVGSRRLIERRPTAIASGPSLPQAAPEKWPEQWPADLQTQTRARLQPAARNGTHQGAVLNGISRGTPADQTGPVHSRRRCLIPGCHHEDHEPAWH